MSEKYMVFVRCITFNHSAYIKDALDGFCMQKTSFPFVCGIVDDASTDGEQSVILDYLKEHFEYEESGNTLNETDDYMRIVAQHKDNRNCFFVVVFLKYNHYSIKKDKRRYTSDWMDSSRYIALNEGDDYWTDNMKLQKQVDFMESHPSHSLCFCAHENIYPSGIKQRVIQYKDNKEICPMRDIILGGGGYMATSAMLFRNSMYISYTTWAKDCPIGDLPTMLSLSQCGSVGFLSDVMCVSRRGVSGSWTSRMGFDIQKRRNHYKAIIKLWHQFDEWSGKRFHKLVSKKIRMNRIDHLKDEVVMLLNDLLKR